MAETAKKIEQLKKKMTAKEMQRDKLTRKLLDTKSNIKTLNREIDDIRLEIRQLELEQLSETLSQNGITAADVAAAIAAGDIKKTVPAVSDEKGEQEDGDTSSKRDTYSTNIETQEVSNNEVSGS